MAAIDLYNITYQVVAALKSGEKLHLEPAAENIAWEENESELAVRLNLTLRDMKTDNGKTIASQLALCTSVHVYATWAGKQAEVFRGAIWQHDSSPIDDEQIIITAYDRLYYLQKHKDNLYFAKGTRTRSIATELLKPHGIPLGRYTGADIAHEKLAFKGKTLGSMMTETLALADENTRARKTIIRMREDKAEIIKQGENNPIYGFNLGENLVDIRQAYSMVDLVTKVIVTGKEPKEGKPPVEATLNGALEYGLLQEIHPKGDASLQEAKNAAQKILNERGKPKRIISVRAPEFPGIRRGDRIHINAGKICGYFYVKGVSHNATTAQMQMEVEPA